MSVIPEIRAIVALPLTVNPAARRRTAMKSLVTTGIALLILWAVLWLGFHIVSGLVHLLLVIAVIMIVWGLVKRGASAVSNKV